MHFRRSRILGALVSFKRKRFEGLSDRKCTFAGVILDTSRPKGKVPSVGAYRTCRFHSGGLCLSDTSDMTLVPKGDIRPFIILEGKNTNRNLFVNVIHCDNK